MFKHLEQSLQTSLPNTFYCCLDGRPRRWQNSALDRDQGSNVARLTPVSHKLLLLHYIVTTAGLATTAARENLLNCYLPSYKLKLANYRQFRLSTSSAHNDLECVDHQAGADLALVKSILTVFKHVEDW